MIKYIVKADVKEQLAKDYLKRHENISSTLWKKIKRQDEFFVNGQTAASLVKPHDLIYIDAGTTTELIIDHLTEKKATYITNGIIHAQKLTDKGFNAFIIGGQLKKSTGAIIGTTSIENLQPYNFTKGFFGTNGISLQAGFSTPDSVEACVKKTALKHCQEAYVLADSTKFAQT